MDIDLSLASKILESIEYKIIQSSEDSLTVEIPYFRTDIEVEDDLVSDILRINNYTNIPLTALSTPVPTDLTPSIYKFEEKLRDLLVAQGAHEHITSSLTTSNSQSDEVVLANALSSDQNALRRSLYPGLSHVLSTYKKHKIKGALVFEIGKVFRKNESAYLEGRLLTVMGGVDSLATLLSSLGINKYHLNDKYEILVDDKVVGTIDAVSYTLVTTALISHVTPYTGIISEFDHKTSLDLSLLVRADLKYSNILKALESAKGEWESISCKSMSAMDDKANNYLISVSWDSSSKSIDSDKDLILKTLKDKLEITSKS
jgi:phenylalanyl-tRNA synthetase beta subunit